MGKQYLTPVILLGIFFAGCQPSTAHLEKMADEACVCFQTVNDAPNYSESAENYKKCNDAHSSKDFNAAYNEFIQEHKGFDLTKLAPIQGKFIGCQQNANKFLEKLNTDRSAEHRAWEEDRSFKRDGTSIVDNWVIDYIGASEIAESAKNAGFEFKENGEFIQTVAEKVRTGKYEFSADGKQMTLFPDPGFGKPKTLNVYEISEQYFTYAEAEGINTGKVRMRRR